MDEKIKTENTEVLQKQLEAQKKRLEDLEDEVKEKIMKDQEVRNFPVFQHMIEMYGKNMLYFVVMQLADSRVAPSYRKVIDLLKSSDINAEAEVKKLESNFSFYVNEKFEESDNPAVFDGLQDEELRVYLHEEDLETGNPTAHCPSDHIAQIITFKEVVAEGEAKKILL